MGSATDAQLPEQFTPLPAVATVPVRSALSVIGFVTDSLPHKLTARGEYMVTFEICDNEMQQQQGTWSNGAKCRFFRRDETQLPLPQRGDIVVLRNMTKMLFQNTPMLISSHTSIVHIIPTDVIPSPDHAQGIISGKESIRSINLPPGYSLDVQTQIHLMHINQTHGEEVRAVLGPHAEPAQPRVVTSTVPRNIATSTSTSTAANMQPHAAAKSLAATHKNPKFSLIKDLQPDKFCDLVVNVVKIFPSPFGDRAQIYVTDYTENAFLMDYPDPEAKTVDTERDGDDYGYIDPKKHSKWPGPWGRRTICLEVHYPHLEYINANVAVGDCVELKNVRIKLDKSSLLEGNMWADQKWPDRVLVTKINPSKNDDALALLGRKDAYWDKRQQGEKKPLSKKQRKVEQRKKAAAEGRKKGANGDVAAATGAIRTNTHVRCGHGEVPFSTLDGMLKMRGKWRSPGDSDEDLPFVNQRRRCRVKVVDYYPLKLEDFSFPRQFDDTTQESMVTDLDDAPPAWEFGFFFLVQDASRPSNKDSAPVETWVHVGDDAAQHLLQLEPSNLREDKIASLRLADKLDILCGNLRDLKDRETAAPPAMDTAVTPYGDRWAGKLVNLPFETCIQEYGQQLDPDDIMTGTDETWLRCFGIFGTTIP